MRYARIYPWRRTRRFRAPSNGPEAFFVAQFSAGYTTNMFGFDLRQGQALDHENRKTPISKPAANAQRPNVQAETRRTRLWRSCGISWDRSVIAATPLRSNCWGRPLWTGQCPAMDSSLNPNVSAVYPAPDIAPPADR